MNMMPELTKERLAEIEARAVDPANPDWRASRCGHNFPIRECMAKTCLAREAHIDSLLLIAEVRRLRAERLTPEEREVVLGALDLQIHESAANAEAWEGRVREAGYLAEGLEARAVRAKIEAARDGGEG